MHRGNEDDGGRRGQRSDEDDGNSAARTEGGIRQAGRLLAWPTRLGDGNSNLEAEQDGGTVRKGGASRGGDAAGRQDGCGDVRRRRGGDGAKGATEETEVPTMRGTKRNRRLTHVGGVHGGDDVDAEPLAASTEQRHSGGGTDGMAAHRRKAALGVAAQARSRRGGG
ncbi:hypothetical protein E2562_005118 [Oryza meyeriana var. granulata]|uniref:DUF834 domain-containing protein n=1 Tax=Oryza meyeriana var. granulata TaxID=110450 RepID=A0A6G1BTM3_9ORYZ|nr:hypothetical protein E2562_005118 [Oryza meyeriana var. granulata]